MAELEIPRTKMTKPIPSYKGFLSLGNFKDNPDTAIAIDVERYPRTMIRSPPSASSFVLRSDTDAKTQDVATDGDDAQAGDGLASVKSLRAYQINDESAPGGKRDLERDELASGYEYGATVVPVSESDQLVLKMETEPTYEIIGFIPVESVR